MTNSLSIAVIVPTYQRPKDALRSMRSLQDQTLKSFQAVLVDNGDDPELRQQTDLFSSSARHPIRYVAEARLGLHFARHAGAACVQADVLVFTDDDATFDPGWLQAYAQAFREYPDMAAAGGPVHPIWETPPPQWLTDWVMHSSIFPVLSLMDPGRDFRLGPEGFFFGVNMAVRRDALFKVGGFNPELIGSMTVGDGESGLNRKLKENGFLIGYVPEALVHHHIPPHRMTVDYVKKWGWHWGGAEMYKRLHGKLLSLPRLMIEAARVFAIYSPFWLLSPLVKNCRDRYSLMALLRSSAGRYQLSYLRWVHSDAQMRQYLAQENHLPGDHRG
jgi:glucosyl-dolichyl phosphate glucuronosyltransferase